MIIVDCISISMIILYTSEEHVSLNCVRFNGCVYVQLKDAILFMFSYSFTHKWDHSWWSWYFQHFSVIDQEWQLVLDTFIYEIALQNDERIGTIRCISAANRSTHSHVFITIPVHTLNPESAVAGNKVLWTQTPFIMVYIEPIFSNLCLYFCFCV